MILIMMLLYLADGEKLVLRTEPTLANTVPAPAGGEKEELDFF